MAQVVPTKSVRLILWIIIIQTAVIAMVTFGNLVTSFSNLKAASSSDKSEQEGGLIGTATVLVFMLFWLWVTIHASRQVLKLREQAEEAV
jgi:hypothetical protein